MTPNLRAAASDATGLREAVEALAAEWATTVYKIPPGYPMDVNRFCGFWFKQPLLDILAAHPDPNHERACGLCRRYGHADADCPTNPANWPAIATAEAEKEALRAERDEIADRLSVVLCDLTGGKLSKTGYSAQTMIQAVEEEFEQRAEAAEAALTGLVAAVEALVDEWLSEEARLKALADEEDAVDLRVSLLKASGSFRGAAIVLRATLTADHAAALRAREAKVLREFADTRGVNVGDDDSEWWRGYRQAQRECLHDAVARADSIEQARP